MSSSWRAEGIGVCCSAALALVMAIAGCRNTDETLLLAPERTNNLPVLPEPSSNEDANAAPDAGGAADEADGVTPVLDPEPASPLDAGGVAADAGADAAPSGPAVPVLPAVVPPGLCARLGADPIAALAVAMDAVVAQQQSECETARLLEGADEVQLLLWADYLFRYSQALLGCEGAEPPAGGLEIFALGNIAEENVGLPLRPLGRDDTEHLIRQYLDQLGMALELSAGERTSFEGYLRLQADGVVVPNLSGALSTCAGNPP